MCPTYGLGEPDIRLVNPGLSNALRFEITTDDRRIELRHGSTTRLQFCGWKERRQREADSRNVRVLDFERALSHLDPMRQQILPLTYRDGVRHAQAASVLGCSPVSYLLPAARRRLATP